MKYTYIYRTSDGIRREGTIEAKCREDAFASLRQRKIKAIKVIACDGSKANGADYGVRKRVVVLASAVAAVAAATLAWFFAPRGEVATHVSFDDTMRRQPLGDELTIEKGIRTGWAASFDTPGDRFLASFAIPGVPPGMRNAKIGELEAALSHEVTSRADDPIEVRQVKAMVVGLKREIRDYLSAGGVLAEYCRRLVQRQEQEIGYHQRVKAELKKAHESKMPRKELEALWEKRNATLRSMGIKLVPFPE